MRYLRIGISGVFVACSIWLCYACASHPVPQGNLFPMGITAVFFAAAGVVSFASALWSTGGGYVGVARLALAMGLLGLLSFLIGAKELSDGR